MKNLFLLGAFALLSTTLFSSITDTFETQITKKAMATYAEGPGDQVIVVPPPK